MVKQVSGQGSGRPRQLSFMDVVKKVSIAQDKPSILKAGSLGIDARIRAIIKDALKNCPLSEGVVAAKMSELLGHNVSGSRLYSWVAPSKGKRDDTAEDDGRVELGVTPDKRKGPPDCYRITFDAAIAFCYVTNNRELLQLAAEKLCCHVIEGEDALLTELGRMKQQKDELARNEKYLRQKLERMGNTSRF